MVVVNTKTRHVTVEITRGPKGAPFTYEDFTPEQLDSLKLTFEDLTAEDKEELKLSFEDLTPEEKDELSLKWDQLTPEQKAELKGEKGDAFTYEDFTAAQLAALKGDKGDPFTYEDFTQAQKDEVFNTFLSNFYDPSVVALSSRGNLEGATFEVKLNKIQNEMNMLDPKPSLLMLPSGVKAGKLYSILPEDGSGDWTVERNSEKTRINQERNMEIVPPNVPAIDYSTGEPMVLVEGESTNNVLWSENQLQSGWFSVWYNSEIAPDIIGIPATRFTNNNVNDSAGYTENAIFNQPHLLPGIHTMTVLVRRGNSNRIRLRIYDLPSSCILDYSFTNNEIISLSGAAISANVDALQNNVYKFTLTYEVFTATSIRHSIAPTTDDNKVPEGLYFDYGYLQVGGNSSYIPTNGSIATRLADNIFQTFPKTGDAVITFADGTTQTISGNEGDTFTLPEGLIKKVQML